MASIDLVERRFEDARVRLIRAIECQRKALAANPNHLTYRQYLVMALTNLIRVADALGHGDEAAQARRELAELAADDPANAALDARLTAVLKGQAPKDDDERIQLAYRANEKTMYAFICTVLCRGIRKESQTGRRSPGPTPLQRGLRRRARRVAPRQG